MKLKKERNQRRASDAERKEKRVQAKAVRRLTEEARRERREANERRAETVVPVSTVNPLRAHTHACIHILTSLDGNASTLSGGVKLELRLALYRSIFACRAGPV